MGELDLEARQSLVFSQVIEHLVDGLRRSRDRAVDAFGGEQQRALDVALQAELLERSLEFVAIGERHELVQCGHE